jgi:hypothetical protein
MRFSDIFVSINFLKLSKLKKLKRDRYDKPPIGFTHARLVRFGTFFYANLAYALFFFY